jgi:hypothetical protein
MPTISGTVRNSLNAPLAGVTVRAYRRDTGALLGSTVTGDGSAGDPDWANVELMLRMNGTPGATTFTDSSEDARTVNLTGAVELTAAQSQFGSSSAAFTGGDLRVAASSTLAPNTGNYTIEGWLRFNSLPAASGFFHFHTGAFFPGDYSNSWAVGTSGAQWQMYAGGSPSSGGTVATGQWYHVAFVRNGSAITLYVDGVSTLAATDNRDLSFDSLGFGKLYGGYPLNGYMDEVRVTKGLARYTAAFTPPTAPFLSGDALPVGEYTITTAHTDEVQVVCLDLAAAPLQNDLIHRAFAV